jgi:hypothetical protein
MAYWLNIFDNYIKTNKNYRIYKKNDDNKKIIIFDNTKFKLYNNIFKMNNNLAYQIHKLSNTKIISDNIIQNIENVNGLKINDNLYEEDIDTKISLESINFFPITHNIKVKSILDHNNYYKVNLYPDLPNEYIYDHSCFYVDKKKLSPDLDIMKYLVINKFIGQVI